MKNTKEELTYLKTLFDVGKEFLNLEPITPKENLYKEINGIYVNGIERENYIHLTLNNDGSLFVGWTAPYKHNVGRIIKVTKRTITYTENYARGYYGKSTRILAKVKNTKELEPIAKLIQPNFKVIVEYLKNNKGLYIDNTAQLSDAFTFEKFLSDFNELKQSHEYESPSKATRIGGAFRKI